MATAYKNKGAHMQNEPSWMAQTIGALGVALTGLSAWAWRHTHTRIDTVETRVENYVTNEAFMLHTKTRDERLDKIDMAMEKTEMQFLMAERDNRVRHEALLDGQTKMLVALEALKK